MPLTLAYYFDTIQQWMEKVYRFATYVLAFALLSALCGCETIVRIFSPRDPIDTSVVATWWDGPRIRPGVSLTVQVGTESMTPVTMTCIVDQNGDIVLQHLLQEPIACDGLTLDALKKKLVKAYQVYYKNPKITVTFPPYDGRGVSPWGTITVLGDVGSPGPVNMPPTMDMTVTKVLQAAGGLKPYADHTRIRITRCDKDGNQTRYKVDLDEIGKEGRPDKDMVLRAGDVVWVPQTWY